MTDLGKILIVIGVVIILAGAIVMGLGRLGFRGLPGDIRIESDNVRFYFPIVTCIVLSVLLTLGLWAWRWFMHR